jgi:hypothetical protein
VQALARLAVREREDVFGSVCVAELGASARLYQRPLIAAPVASSRSASAPTGACGCQSTGQAA